jgi:hypothetical protein
MGKKTKRVTAHCFDGRDHAPHKWTFYYMDPPSKCWCPGLAKPGEMEFDSADAQNRIPK